MKQRLLSGFIPSNPIPFQSTPLSLRHIADFLNRYLYRRLVFVPPIRIDDDYYLHLTLPAM